MTDPLICPTCHRRHGGGERFCSECGMPLVYAGLPVLDEPDTAAHGRARKVKKQFTEGDLVRVAGGRNQAEAEFIQGMLLEEGVPSMLKRTRGFDVPDMLAAGPRDVMVPASGAAVAREVLLEAELVDPQNLGAGRGDAPSKVLLALMGACLVAGLLAWVGTELLT